MSSTAYATPLSLELRSSATLGVLVTVAHAGAAVSLAFTSLPLWVLVPGAVGVLVSLLRVFPRFVSLRHPDAVHRVLWPAGDEWHLFTRGGQELVGTLLPETYLRPWLVVLRFKLPRSRMRRSVVILPDMLDANVMRRLRVRLGLNPPRPRRRGADEPF